MGAPVARASRASAATGSIAPSARASALIASGAASRLEAHDVRQEHGVRRRVRQPEHAAEHVTELVVQPAAGVGEDGAGEVRALERVLARAASSARDERTSALAASKPQRLLRRERARDRRVVHPQRLDGVGHRVPQARHGRRRAGAPR